MANKKKPADGAHLELDLQTHKTETAAQIQTVRDSVSTLQGSFEEVQRSVSRIETTLLAEFRALLLESRTPTPTQSVEPVVSSPPATDLAVVSFGSVPEIAGEVVSMALTSTAIALGETTVAETSQSTAKGNTPKSPLTFSELAHSDVILGLTSELKSPVPKVVSTASIPVNNVVKAIESTKPVSDVNDSSGSGTKKGGNVDVSKNSDRGGNVDTSKSSSTVKENTQFCPSNQYFQHTNFGTNPFNYMTGPFTVPHPNFAQHTAYSFAPTTHVSSVEPSVFQLPYYAHPTNPYPIPPTPTSLPPNSMHNSPYSAYTTVHSKHVYPPHPLFGAQSPNGAWLRGYTPPSSTHYPHLDPILPVQPNSQFCQQQTNSPQFCQQQPNLGPTYASSPHIASLARPPFNQPNQPYTHSVTSPGNQLYPPRPIFGTQSTVNGGWLQSNPPCYPQVHTSTPQYTTVFTTPQNHNFVPPNHNFTPPNHSFVPQTPNFDLSLPTMKQMRWEFANFSGGDPMEWLNKVEQFFEFYQVPDDRKLAIETMHLTEKASDSWYMFKSEFPQTWQGLTDMLKKDNFKWTSNSETAFDQLKAALMTTPVLAIPDFSKPFVVECDASNKGIGAVLSQGGHPVVFLSKALSVVFAVQHWKPYLLDALSRQLELSAITRISTPVHSFVAEMQAACQHDGEVHEIMHDLEQGCCTNKDYFVRDSPVFYKGKVFVPRVGNWRRKIISELHDGLTGEHAGNWVKALPWAEFWFNSSHHSAIQMSPFQALYGYQPPPISPYLPGSTAVAQVDQELQARDTLLATLRKNLELAQSRMKIFYDKRHTEREFVVGDWEYLKLHHYKQLSLQQKGCHKLSPLYFGPFQVVELIGKVAYTLLLPSTAKIHNVFHVSLLKKKLGTDVPISPQLPHVADPIYPRCVPMSVLARRIFRKKDVAGTQWLVQWKDIFA